MAKQQDQQIDATMAEAMETARGVVRERWPEFAGVAPNVSRRATHTLHSADASRLGIAGSAVRPDGTTQYTFTFAREEHTPEGYTIPHVARITVDANQQVVKAVVSK